MWSCYCLRIDYSHAWKWDIIFWRYLIISLNISCKTLAYDLNRHHARSGESDHFFRLLLQPKLKTNIRATRLFGAKLSAVRMYSAILLILPRPRRPSFVWLQCAWTYGHRNRCLWSPTKRNSAGLGTRPRLTRLVQLCKALLRACCEQSWRLSQTNAIHVSGMILLM